jgi:hypothetical protein
MAATESCPSGITGLGLEFDFRYLLILMTLQYSGPLPTTTSPDQVSQDSAVMRFRCVVMQTDNPNFQSFEINQAFLEKYRNMEVAILFITSG